MSSDSTRRELGGLSQEFGNKEKKKGANWLGGLLAYFILAILLIGIWRGSQRPTGRTTGLNGAWLHSAWFYLTSTVLFIGIGYFGWIPMELRVSSQTRTWMLVLGVSLYFPSLLIALWGRIALGKNYFVSTGFGAQLFKDHQLVTSGPFAIVRHPMYTGLMLAALGSLLIYSTWTTLLFAIFTPLISIRARREEAALAAEFGEGWQLLQTRAGILSTVMAIALFKGCSFILKGGDVFDGTQLGLCQEDHSVEL
jgi:protein-S-isoprenylcysteine O-methyltransferase Ste14